MVGEWGTPKVAFTSTAVGSVMLTDVRGQIEMEEQPTNSKPPRNRF